ncbi:MAG: nicotinate-nucleotide adenylyltransferase [bacterium]
MNIGIFGGTFNPIHLGHLRTALEILERYRMKQILFVPSSIPPHKSKSETASAIHRLKMVNLAITGNPSFAVSETEIHRRGKSYSIDTIRGLKKEYPDDKLAFIMGMDAFMEINTWHKYQELFNECDFIVHSRGGMAKVGWQQAIPSELKSRFKKKGNSKQFTHSSGSTLTFCEVTPLGISASAIREMVRGGHSIRYLLPRRVLEYIHENNLYK